MRTIKIALGYIFFLKYKKTKKRFAGALQPNLRRMNGYLPTVTATAVSVPLQSPLSLLLPLMFLPRKKEGEIVYINKLLYRLLNIRISKAKTTTIATIMPAETGMKYKSATDAGVGVGGGVVSGASSTFIAV